MKNLTNKKILLVIIAIALIIPISKRIDRKLARHQIGNQAEREMIEMAGEYGIVEISGLEDDLFSEEEYREIEEEMIEMEERYMEKLEQESRANKERERLSDAYVAGPMSEWITYRDDQFEFSVQHPEDWEVEVTIRDPYSLGMYPSFVPIDDIIFSYLERELKIGFYYEDFTIEEYIESVEIGSLADSESVFTSREAIFVKGLPIEKVVHIDVYGEEDIAFLIESPKRLVKIYFDPEDEIHQDMISTLTFK